MMNTYILLLRGINVGGKNKVPMSTLRQVLERLGFANVSTYIASGNVLLDSDQTPIEIRDQVERALIENFTLDSDVIKVLVLSRSELQWIVDRKPEGFGEQPDTYHSDAIFLIDIDATEAFPVFNPRDGVDTVWPGQGVIYSQRLSAQRTRSRLSAMIASPLYQSMTIRNWSTTTKLLDLLNQRDAAERPEPQ